MFIAHLPAGWVATAALLRGHDVGPSARRRLFALGLLASVLPDFDLAWFYWVDDQQHVHHAYVTHKPAAWLLALAAVAMALWIRRASRTAWLALSVFGANVMLHLVLDTTAGGIRWLWPATETEFAIAQPTARYEPWYMNFVLHWTFALEMMIVAAGVVTFARRGDGAHREHGVPAAYPLNEREGRVR